MPVGNSPHVAVIGGGFGGILAAVECLQAGWEVTIFEANASWGGIWRETSQNVEEHCIGVHASTCFNTSSYSSAVLLEPLLMQFVDSISSNPFPTSAQFRAYIQLILEKYKITPHILYRHRITSIQFHPQSSQVLVKCTDLARQHCMEQYFDFVIVAVGGFKEPYYPRIPGLPLTEPGVGAGPWNAPLQRYVYHACQFDAHVHFDRFERILVVGGSISASEIVEALLIHQSRAPQACTVDEQSSSPSEWKKKVFWNVSSRPDKANIWIFNRFNEKGQAVEENLCRFLMVLAPPFLKAILSRLYLTLFSSCGKRCIVDPNLDSLMCVDPQIMLKARQEGRLNLVHPLESIQIEEKTIRCHLKEHTGSLEVDAVVFATGYRRDYSFLPESSRQELQVLLARKKHLLKDLENYKNHNNSPVDWGRPILYKDMLPLDPNLNCVGFIGTRRYAGSSFPVLQMESKWLVQHWKSGGWSMEKRLQEYERILSSDSLCKYQLSASGNDSSVIVDSLAQDLGMQPKSFLWLIQPSFYSHRVAFGLLFGPWSMLHYRLNKLSTYSSSSTTEEIIFRCQQKMGNNTFNALCSLYSLTYGLTLIALPPFILSKCL